MECDAQNRVGRENITTQICFNLLPGSRENVFLLSVVQLLFLFLQFKFTVQPVFAV